MPRTKMNPYLQRSFASTKGCLIPIDVENKVHSHHLFWQHGLNTSFTEKQALSSLITKYAW